MFSVLPMHPQKRAKMSLKISKWRATLAEAIRPANARQPISKQGQQTEWYPTVATDCVRPMQRVLLGASGLALPTQIAPEWIQQKSLDTLDRTQPSSVTRSAATTDATHQAIIRHAAYAPRVTTATDALWSTDDSAVASPHSQ